MLLIALGFDYIIYIWSQLNQIFQQQIYPLIESVSEKVTSKAPSSLLGRPRRLGSTPKAYARKSPPRIAVCSS